MNQTSHRQWLYTKFPVAPVVSENCDLTRQQAHNNLRGRRVWSKTLLVDWQGYESGVRCAVVVPSEMGGTVVFHGTDDVFVVRWDNGRVAMHLKDDLLRSAVLIGAHESLKSYLDGMRQHTCAP